MTDHNPHLKATVWKEDARKGGSSSIETYDPAELIEWQTRPAPPTEYENALGDALEAIFTQEVYDLAGIVAKLNETGPSDPDGKAWTEASFKSTMKKLGDGNF